MLQRFYDIGQLEYFLCDVDVKKINEHTLIMHDKHKYDEYVKKYGVPPKC